MLNSPGCSFRQHVGVCPLPALTAEMTLACTAVQLARLSQLPERRLSDSASQFYLKSLAELKKSACILSWLDQTAAVSNHTSDFIIAFSLLEASKSPSGVRLRGSTTLSNKRESSLSSASRNNSLKGVHKGREGQITLQLIFLGTASNLQFLLVSTCNPPSPHSSRYHSQSSIELFSRIVLDRALRFPFLSEKLPRLIFNARTKAMATAGDGTHMQ